MCKDLEAFDRIKQEVNGCLCIYHIEENDVDIVEKSLLKAQDNKKVLEIINNKGVDVGYLKKCKTLDDYNSNCWDDEEDFNKKLTLEEFDTLKRWHSE